MAVDNQFKETVDALFKGMNGVVSSKTVVGDAIHIGDTIILPLVDVSFAMPLLRLQKIHQQAEE